MPRSWTAPTHLFNYALDQVVLSFYNRYPNSRATHVISEDVLSRDITADQIITRKLIVKRGANFRQSMPGWIARRIPDVNFMPTLEESIYNRRDHTFTTHTRNINCLEMMQMEEGSLYAPAEDNPQSTSLVREVYINVDYGRISGIAEHLLLVAFKKSAKRANDGITEKLQEFYAAPATTDGHQGEEDCRMRRIIREKLHLEQRKAS